MDRERRKKRDFKRDTDTMHAGLGHGSPCRLCDIVSPGKIEVKVPLPLALAPAFTQAPGDLVTATNLLVKINPITIMLSAMVSLLTAFLTGFVLSARLIRMKPSEALVL